MEPAQQAPELPTLSLDVLQIVKEAQGLHGLKHSDYQRYRCVAVASGEASVNHPAGKSPLLEGLLGAGNIVADV
jgi:hypothetical protein